MSKPYDIAKDCHRSYTVITKDTVILAFETFEALAGKPYKTDKKIEVNLRAHRQIGTVQDDPFDEWTYEVLESNKVSERIYRAGRLKSPDITLINDTTNSLLGLEVKKLEADKNGKDPRGLTLDYNSTVPCGRTTVLYNGKLIDIPLYYYFALIQNNRIISTVFCDGDFLSNDYEFHKDSKISNTSTYGHGSYGEASIRHRKMYLFPNPLNTNLSLFSKKHSLILPIEVKEIAEKYAKDQGYTTKTCVREANNGKKIEFIIVYTNTDGLPNSNNFQNIFEQCREREPKGRSPYVVSIPNK